MGRPGAFGSLPGSRCGSAGFVRGSKTTWETRFRTAGRIEEALSQYREFLILRPDIPRSLHLACPIRAWGGLEEAMAQYKEALP